MNETENSFFASSSVRVHMVRGVVGLVALVGGVVALGPLGAPALILFPVAFVAWRGCPTCWALGLAATRERVACESCPARNTSALRTNETAYRGG